MDVNIYNLAFVRKQEVYFTAFALVLVCLPGFSSWTPWGRQGRASCSFDERESGGAGLSGAFCTAESPLNVRAGHSALPPPWFWFSHGLCRSNPSLLCSQDSEGLPSIPDTSRHFIGCFRGTTLAGSLTGLMCPLDFPPQVLVASQGDGDGVSPFQTALWTLGHQDLNELQRFQLVPDWGAFCLINLQPCLQ